MSFLLFRHDSAPLADPVLRTRRLASAVSQRRDFPLLFQYLSAYAALHSARQPCFRACRLSPFRLFSCVALRQNRILILQHLPASFAVTSLRHSVLRTRRFPSFISDRFVPFRSDPLALLQSFPASSARDCFASSRSRTRRLFSFRHHLVVTQCLLHDRSADQAHLSLRARRFPLTLMLRPLRRDLQLFLTDFFLSSFLSVLLPAPLACVVRFHSVLRTRRFLFRHVLQPVPQCRHFSLLFQHLSAFLAFFPFRQPCFRTRRFSPCRRLFFVSFRRNDLLLFRHLSAHSAVLSFRQPRFRARRLSPFVFYFLVRFLRDPHFFRARLPLSSFVFIQLPADFTLIVLSVPLFSASRFFCLFVCQFVIVRRFPRGELYAPLQRPQGENLNIRFSSGKGGAGHADVRQQFAVYKRVGLFRALAEVERNRRRIARAVRRADVVQDFRSNAFDAHAVTDVASVSALHIGAVDGQQGAVRRVPSVDPRGVQRIHAVEQVDKESRLIGPAAVGQAECDAVFFGQIERNFVIEVSRPAVDKDGISALNPHIAPGRVRACTGVCRASGVHIPAVCVRIFDGLRLRDAHVEVDCRARRDGQVSLSLRKVGTGKRQPGDVRAVDGNGGPRRADLDADRKIVLIPICLIVRFRKEEGRLHPVVDL